MEFENCEALVPEVLVVLKDLKMIQNKRTYNNVYYTIVNLFNTFVNTFPQ